MSEAWQDIPIEQIERIEVVRGPRASLYGSEAIGGVIQIFTKKGAQKPAFSLERRFARHVRRFRQRRFRFRRCMAIAVAGSADKTRGINACQFGTGGGCGVDQPDRDGYSNTSINFTWRCPLRRVASTASYEFLQFSGKNKYDGSLFGGDENGSSQQIAGATLNYVPVDAWRSSVHVGEDTDDIKSYNDGIFLSRFMTRRDTASWQNDITLGKGHTLVAGVDYLRDEVISNTLYNIRSRSNRGIFAEYLADIGAFSLQFAGRHDDNEQFGSHNTGSVASGYAFSKALRLTASYGTAFKAPTFNQLYFPGFGVPTLKPETSRNRELGAGGEFGSDKEHAGKWQVNVFDNRIDNLIASTLIGAASVSSNVSHARIHGVELSSSGHWEQTSLAANVTLQNPKDHSGAATEGNLLARRSTSDSAP